MGCLIAFLVLLAIFLFHLAAVSLFCISFVLVLVGTGDLGISLIAGIIGAVAGAYIQMYSNKNF